MDHRRAGADVYHGGDDGDQRAALCPGGLASVAGADPDVYGSVILAVVAVLFAILVWIIPNRAAGMAGRGAALALTGEQIVASGMAGVQGAQFAARAAMEVVRGVSPMVRV